MRRWPSFKAAWIAGPTAPAKQAEIATVSSIYARKLTQKLMFEG
jgi:hypothetical protein